MSVFYRINEGVFSAGHSNFIYHLFKRTKCNFKYRKLYLYCPARKVSNTSEINVNISSIESTRPNNFIPFETLLEQRRNEAKRSIGVQVQSESSSKELYHYCKGIASVRTMFYYKVHNNHYFLVEFADDSSAQHVLKKCIHSSGASVIPAKSPFVWFKASKNGGKIHRKSAESLSENELPLIPSALPSEKEIREWLEQTCSLSDSIKVLYDGTRLDELGIRLRFLTARQIEMSLEGLFPGVAALPFGSTVNGLGKAGCDLDLVLQHDYKLKSNGTYYPPSRLAPHHKSVSNTSGSRQHVQRQMEVLADLIQLYLPGCVSVKRILQARVPIVKYSHDYTGVECDLSMTNMTGVYMSELLYLMGCLDPLARPLVFTVKQWAWAANLTNPSPGRWITNFTLTLLTLFYLQVIKRLPSMDILKAAASAEDKRITEEIDCTFIRNLNNLKWKSPPNHEKQELSHLLKGFFDYYTRFDFASAGISLGTGKCEPKQDFSPLFVVNPLERSANVSKNVSLEEVERLRIAFRDASWSLEAVEIEQKSFINLVTKTLAINETSHKKYIPNRMVSVKRLFTE